MENPQRGLRAAYQARQWAFGNGRFACYLLKKMIEPQTNRIVSLQPITNELLNSIMLEDVQ